MPTDEELGRAAFKGDPGQEWHLDLDLTWESAGRKTRERYTAIARAVRQALKGNGLAGQWVEWGYNTSHYGVVLEHDHGGNMVKIAQDGDTTRTYWLNADEVLVMERDGDEHE